MSKKAEKVEVKQVGNLSGLISFAEEKATPIPVGFSYWKYDEGSVVTGVFIGLDTKSREDLESEVHIPDGRRKNITVAKVLTDDRAGIVCGGVALIDALQLVRPGSIVRITCTRKQQGSASHFDVDLLVNPEDVVEMYPDVKLLF